MAAIRELERRLPKGWTKEDLSASIQQHSEELVRRYVSHWARKTGLRDAAMAGGVFSNVRINEEVHRLPEVDRIFVHPGMAACVPSDPEPLRDVYLGEDITEREAADALRQHGLTPEPLDGSIEDAVADLLVQGYVVARADGRMEYGPRWVIARFCISRRIARSTTG